MPTSGVGDVLRVATFNVNGIRAALRRGLGEWLRAHSPDVVALQEVRCPPEVFPREALPGYHVSYDAGTLPGRNGVAVLSRTAPSRVRVWGGNVAVLDADGRPRVFAADPDRPDDAGGVRVLGPSLARELRQFAHEGRHIEVDLDAHRLTVGSLYLPKGGTPFEDEASQTRLERKLRFMSGFARQLGRSRRAASARGHEYLVMGDFNIAHTPQDVNNARTKHRSEGFLPSEREWFATQLGPRTLVDVVRTLRPDEQGPYSWWSWRGQSWNSDAGWRIDYQLATPGLARRAVSGGTLRDPSYEERISDHAPVVVDYRCD